MQYVGGHKLSINAFLSFFYQLAPKQQKDAIITAYLTFLFLKCDSKLPTPSPLGYGLYYNYNLYYYYSSTHWHTFIPLFSLHVFIYVIAIS